MNQGEYIYEISQDLVMTWLASHVWNSTCVLKFQNARFKIPERSCFAKKLEMSKRLTELDDEFFPPTKKQAREPTSHQTCQQELERVKNHFKTDPQTNAALETAIKKYGTSYSNIKKDYFPKVYITILYNSSEFWLSSYQLSLYKTT